MKKHFFCPFLILVASFILISCSVKDEAGKKPNILLIVADDLGYGDISCYGGEIKTPNIDMLAERGLRFSRFHTAPMCAPTRAMLLSGNDNHIAGMGIQGLTLDSFGYEGMLTDRIIPIPVLLKQAGYQTFMAGKWHLGYSAEANPHNKGFDRSFVLLSGAGNHYDHKSVINPGNSKYTENGDSTDWETGAYSTDFYTDKLIEYIDQNKGTYQPFFAFATYTSPHWPLQVDRKHWSKYEGQYNEGYEALRIKRLEGLKRVGMIPEDHVLPSLLNPLTPWDSLSWDAQEIEARKMELYAGMVDNLDYNVGRLIDYLKEIDEFDNTYIVFMSDNGAAHRDFFNHERFSHLKSYFNNDFENMGKPNSYVSYGPPWAEAGSAPFKYYKDFASEGGINTTMILCGPNVHKKNEISHSFVTLLDLAPTFYELAGVQYPDTFESNAVYPLLGEPLTPLTTGRSDHIHDDTYVFALEHAGNAMLRKGDWKITNTTRPFSPENFELYNVTSDLGERNNLRDSMPGKYQELMKEWHEYASRIRL